MRDKLILSAVFFFVYVFSYLLALGIRTFLPFIYWKVGGLTGSGLESIQTILVLIFTPLLVIILGRRFGKFSKEKFIVYPLFIIVLILLMMGFIDYFRSSLYGFL